VNEQQPDGRRTQIIATVGPSSDSRAPLEAMVRAGMDVARINFSHATHHEAAAVARHLRDIEAAGGRPVAMLGDLQGLKLRIGDLAATLDLRENEAFALTARPGERGPAIVSADLDAILGGLRAGQHVFLRDGSIDLEITDVQGGVANTLVRVGGQLTSRAGLLVPGVGIEAPALTPEDQASLDIAVELGMQWVALSFVGDASDIEATRAALDARGGTEVRIVAKIERRSALDHLDSIAAASDALMVARGDLGVEVGVESLPIWQRRLLAVGRAHAVPVVVATEMLESMRTHERPTRAEASDVAYSVWDGAAALLLSAETAVGRHPARVVSMMDRIIRRAESEAAR